MSATLLVAGPAHAGTTIDVGLGKTHAGNFTVGQPGVFTFTISNVGASDTGTDEITVTDDLPAGLTYASDTGAANGYPCNHSGQHIVCTGLPTPIAPGGSVSFTVTVTVDASAVPSVTNTAVVSDEFGADNNPDNDTATDTVNVDAAATTTTTAPASTTTTAPVATQPEGLARTGSATAAAIIAGFALIAGGFVVLRLRRFSLRSR